MHLAKRLLARFRRHFPHGGYQLAVLFGGVLLVTPLYVRLATLSVIVSALAGISHLLAPPERRGRWPYWALTYAWLAAAALGLLAEWHALDPFTPWFSLARYVLCGGAMLGVAVSIIRGEPLFVRIEGLRSSSLSYVATGVMQVVLLLMWLWFLAPDRALRLALSPRHPEAHIEILLSTCDTEDRRLWAMSLSPDAQHVLLADADGVWAAGVDAPAALARKAAGVFSMDSPWLPSGESFYLSRKEEPGRYSIWLADISGSPVRKIVDDCWDCTCSPDGEWIAYANQEGVWLANPDGSAPRLLFPDGTSARWSPDGKRLLCTVRRRPLQRREHYVALLDGEIRRLDTPVEDVSIMWLGPTRLLTIYEGERDIFAGTLFLRPEAYARIWTLDGKEERSFGLGVSCAAEVSPSPDGGRLALGTSVSRGLNLSCSAHGTAADAPIIRYELFLMDLATSRVTRLPTPGDVSGVDWSADGRTLLVNGTETVRDGRESEVGIRSTLALVSGM